MIKKQSKTKRFFKRIEGFFASFKQRYIINYLLTKAGGKELIARYTRRTNDDCRPLGADAPIWVCWWQGADAMPDIAKACFNSIKMHAGTHPVILITGENYKEYVTLPSEIVEKQQKGIIDLTHFSDILRAVLLHRHGGIWMDSTVLLPAKNIDEFIHASDTFWSCHHLPIYHNVSRGGWTSFFWACGKNNLLPSFIADLHISYWKRFDKLIDYLLLDYTFAIARKYIPAIHRMIEEVPITVMGPLGKCLNDEYTEAEWKRFCTDYDFHKLTYKIQLHKTTPEGKKTFYGHIMENYFPKEQVV